MEGAPLNILRPLAGAALIIAALAGCATDRAAPDLVLPNTISASAGQAGSAAPTGPLSLAPPAKPTTPAEIIGGTGGVLRVTGRSRAGVSEEAGEITFNFENAEIRSVAKAVLGDTLQLDYTIDPSILGAMYLHTAAPLPRDAVLPAFEDALRLSGVALVAHGHRYDLVPLQDAAHRAALDLQATGTLAPGFHVELLPVRFVSVADIQKVLEPMARPGTIIRVDPTRNLIVLAGTEAELATLADTAAMFDVDWLQSQSFGLYPLHYAPAKSVATELGQVVGTDGPLAGLVRITAIDRLNAILVVSQQREYIEEMRGWIDRFDRGGDRTEARLYVYPVQNGRAADLASVLGKALTRSGSGGTAGQSRTGGATASTGEEPAQFRDQSAVLPAAEPAGNTQSPLGNVTITADETNNSLIVLATPGEYELVEAALHQLDAVPLQVLLEATVAEVSLTTDLQYGVESFLKKGSFSILSASSSSSTSGTATTGTTSTASSFPPVTGGLSVALSRGTSVQALLDLLSTVTRVRVISAPEVMVLNSHTASLDVGDQVPVATASAVSVQSSGAPIVNSIQMQATGIILKVTPRVNQGGLVLLDVDQEVSTSVPTTSSAIDSPTIQERKISSSIAVQDGQTIALGGLISDNRTNSRTGIPLLGDLPWVGAAFSTTSDNVDRTELLVLMTPHVVRDEKSAQEATEELRAKLPLMRTFDRATPH